MSRLSTPAYPNDAPIHGLTDIPLRLLSTDIGCGTLLAPRRSRQNTATHAARDPNLDGGNQDMSRLSTPAYPNDAPIHGLTDMRLAYSLPDPGTAGQRHCPELGTHSPLVVAWY
jgi:hypothetical protein